MSKTSTIHDYARIGAAARLTEIQVEIAAIRKAFPEMGGAVAKGRRGRLKTRPAASGPETEAEGSARPKLKRRKMSAAARKAISDAQKKRWAAQKAAAA